MASKDTQHSASRNDIDYYSHDIIAINSTVYWILLAAVGFFLAFAALMQSKFRLPLCIVRFHTKHYRLYLNRTRLHNITWLQYSLADPLYALLFACVLASLWVIPIGGSTDSWNGPTKPIKFGYMAVGLVSASIITSTRKLNIASYIIRQPIIPILQYHKWYVSKSDIFAKLIWSQAWLVRMDTSHFALRSDSTTAGCARKAE